MSGGERSPEIAQVYAHRIHVNIGGSAMRPVVALWCSDCLTSVGNFDQSNDWSDLGAAVAEHRTKPSRREQSTSAATARAIADNAAAETLAKLRGES